MLLALLVLSISSSWCWISRKNPRKGSRLWYAKQIIKWRRGHVYTLYTLCHIKRSPIRIFKIIDVFVKVVDHVCICLVLVRVVVCVKLSRDFICQILKKSFGAPLQDGPPNAEFHPPSQYKFKNKHRKHNKCTSKVPPRKQFRALIIRCKVTAAYIPAQWIAFNLQVP